MTDLSRPIFADVFGPSWEALPPVFKAHYANRPYSQDRATVAGQLDVRCRSIMRWLAPFLILSRSIPPYNGTNVPATVHFTSDVNTRRFHFRRIFSFAGRKPYAFNSYMEQTKGAEVVEITATGFGWKMRYAWENDKVVMHHVGYVVRLLGYTFPVPLEFILGRVYAEEVAADENSFAMQMYMTHPFFGKIYEYKGCFTVTKEVA
jgi:Domain of unknown function (DUF4166)